MAGLVFKITIEDTHPPVWRRIIFPEQASFQDLHDVIQTAFGMMIIYIYSKNNGRLQ